MENSLFRAFDVIVRRQLAPYWHRIGPRTRKLTEDLTTLRMLLQNVISLDCVTLHWKLESLLMQNQNTLQTGGASGLYRRQQSNALTGGGGWRPNNFTQNEVSTWLMSDPANVLFSVRLALSFYTFKYLHLLYQCIDNIAHNL